VLLQLLLDQLLYRVTRWQLASFVRGSFSGVSLYSLILSVIIIYLFVRRWCVRFKDLLKSGGSLRLSGCGCTIQIAIYG
jgi:hypothetical protein